MEKKNRKRSKEYVCTFTNGDVIKDTFILNLCDKIYHQFVI